MENNFYAVIMAGGVGSRFWPVSTQEFPKQFHDMLGSGQTLLQKTFARLNQMIPSENIYILTNERYLGITLEQLPEIDETQVVLEPAMRNTAPCILLSALKIQKENPDAKILVAPSDHWIEDETAFENDVRTCFEHIATHDHLLTLGIHPTFPNTGYGYIESEKNDPNEIKKVIQFREKPDYETAKAFLASGNFVWNAGIFLWSAKSIVHAFEKHLPVMSALFAEGGPVLNTPQEREFIERNYAYAENISVDYGIMERADNVYVKRATFDWNDLGTWGSLHEKLAKDENRNSIISAETFLKDAKNNLIFTTSPKLVVIDGIENYVVVDKKDVLLVFPMEKEQEIKGLLKELSNKFGDKYI